MHRLQYGISSSLSIQEPHHRLGMVNREYNSSKKSSKHNIRQDNQGGLSCPGLSIVKSVHNHAYDEYLAIFVISV